MSFEDEPGLGEGISHVVVISYQSICLWSWVKNWCVNMSKRNHDLLAQLFNPILNIHHSLPTRLPVCLTSQMFDLELTLRAHGICFDWASVNKPDPVTSLHFTPIRNLKIMIILNIQSVWQLPGLLFTHNLWFQGSRSSVEKDSDFRPLINVQLRWQIIIEVGHHHVLRKFHFA